MKMTELCMKITILFLAYVQWFPGNSFEWLYAPIFTRIIHTKVAVT